MREVQIGLKKDVALCYFKISYSRAYILWQLVTKKNLGKHQCSDNISTMCNSKHLKLKIRLSPTMQNNLVRQCILFTILLPVPFSLPSPYILFYSILYLQYIIFYSILYSHTAQNQSSNNIYAKYPIDYKATF